MRVALVLDNTGSMSSSGKMKALHERFRNHTCRLFEKHGMKLVGFWSPTDAAEADKKMIYLLAYLVMNLGAFLVHRRRGATATIAWSAETAS